MNNSELGDSGLVILLWLLLIILLSPTRQMSEVTSARAFNIAQFSQGLGYHLRFVVIAGTLGAPASLSAS